MSERSQHANYYTDARLYRDSKGELRVEVRLYTQRYDGQRTADAYLPIDFSQNLDTVFAQLEQPIKE